MSIATKTGDKGTTALMYNRRVSKAHPRIQACGGVDELNTALGMVRAVCTDSMVQETIVAVQKDLIVLMGELATTREDLERFVGDGFSLVTAEMTVKLDKVVQDIESRKISFHGWATPGANLPAATLDVARTTCRRAERAICVLQEADEFNNPHVLVYLNRLSDALWLLARWVEQP